MVIRIRVSAARRVFDAVKAMVIAVGLVLLASLLRPDRWSGIGDLLAIAAIVGVSVALMFLLRAGEVVHVTAGEVRILKPLESFSVSRGEQAAPIYSALPSRLLFPQRMGDERGSGVLLFGSHERGVRFGANLDAPAAREVLGAFSLPSAPPPSVAAPSGFAWRVVRFVPWILFVIVFLGLWMLPSLELSGAATFAVVGIIAFALFLIDDALGRRFPQRVKVG